MELVNIRQLIDPQRCFEAVRQLRWPNGVRCSHCDSDQVNRNGRDESQAHRQRYICKACNRSFDDLTDTIFEGHHKPLEVWILCLYFMGLNLSNSQIGQELDLPESEVQGMTKQLREGVVKKPIPQLNEEVEVDEIYVVAGHKGHPEVVAQKGREGRKRRLKGRRGRGTMEGEKPPIVGFVQRYGEVAMFVCDNVQRSIIRPLFEKVVARGSKVFHDDYGIYDDLEKWGYEHKTVCHSAGEYARDEDKDGFFEVHVNTIEGIWSLLRSWLRPHRGISQELLHLYVGFFEFVYNCHRRGKKLLSSLIEILVNPESYQPETR